MLCSQNMVKYGLWNSIVEDNAKFSTASIVKRMIKNEIKIKSDDIFDFL